MRGKTMEIELEAHEIDPKAGLHRLVTSTTCHNLHLTEVIGKREGSRHWAGTLVRRLGARASQRMSYYTYIMSSINLDTSIQSIHNNALNT